MSKETLSMQQAEYQLQIALQFRKFSASKFAAHAAIWLEACGYPGLQILRDALADPVNDLTIERIDNGLDLHNRSCVYIGQHVVDDILLHGRTPLRNVRHGLYLVPASVAHNLSIGCAVDVSFTFGGLRSKNPYQEKLNMATEAGVHFDSDLWQKLLGASK